MTNRPSGSPSAAPTFSTQDDTNLSGILLVLIFAGGIFTVGLTYNYAMQTTQAISFKGFIMQLLCLYAIILTLLSLSLMLQWASNNNTTLDTGFLGEPSYSSNIFAYHPLLMVVGFFLFQVFAVLSWYIVPSYTMSKISHFLLHTAALVCMGQSINCIRKAALEYTFPSAVTLHSWVGISCVTIFLFNYIYGLYMAFHRMAASADTKPGFLQACVQTDLGQYLSRHMRQYINWFKLYHKLSGCVVLVFTAMSIITGISITMSGECYYRNQDGFVRATPDMVNNPGDYYNLIPLSCKTANGLGLSVILCTMCLIAFVMLRNIPESFEPHFPEEQPEGDGGAEGRAPGDVVWTENQLSRKSTHPLKNAHKVELGVELRPSVAL